MTWRGECDRCGAEVVWAGDEGSGAQPDWPGPGQKVVCLACACFGSGTVLNALQEKSNET